MTHGAASSRRTHPTERQFVRVAAAGEFLVAIDGAGGLFLRNDYPTADPGWKPVQLPTGVTRLVDLFLDAGAGPRARAAIVALDPAGNVWRRPVIATHHGDAWENLGGRP